VDALNELAWTDANRSSQLARAECSSAHRRPDSLFLAFLSLKFW
jgi:hypothetical protein